jgi:hypothetical protein
LENLKFFSDRELNPHSILDEVEKFVLKFFLIENITMVNVDTIKIERKI